MTFYLLPEQVLFLHHLLIEKTGGMHGVRDLSMLLSALGRPQASFDGKDLYPALFSKAAALMDSLIRNHPFVDGNKRTAFAAAGIFLELNQRQLIAGNEEAIRFALACAQAQIPLDEMVTWFKKNCK